MCDAMDGLLLEGVTLPSTRLLGQCRSSLALADADEPELAGCGWTAFRTESLRRAVLTLDDQVTRAGSRGSIVEDPLSVRIYDVFRKARDLMETVHVYATLAFEGEPGLWEPVLAPAGPGALTALLDGMRRLSVRVLMSQDALMSEGLHPMVPQRLAVATSQLEWAVGVQAQAVCALSQPARLVAQLKARTYQDLVRLNRIGRLAYRHDAGHRARYNLEVLNCRQPALTAPGFRVERRPPPLHTSAPGVAAAR